jgi:Flp pilus assembly protein TadD
LSGLAVFAAAVGLTRRRALEFRPLGPAEPAQAGDGRGRQERHWEGPLRRLVEGAADRPLRTARQQLQAEGDLYEHFQAGMELLEQGHPAQAAVRLEKARRGAPGKASVREALGRAYFELGRFRDAQEEFQSVVEVDPTNDYAHFCLSRVFQRRGRFKQAELHLKLARAMNPGQQRYRRWSTGS